jgi:hypothetical protein
MRESLRGAPLRRVLRAASNPRLILRKIQRVIYLPIYVRIALGHILPPYGMKPRKKSIYIVTYGRSGSTLLMKYICRLPGCDIQGENFLFLLPLMSAEERLRRAEAVRSRNTTSYDNPWYGSQNISSKRWRRDVLHLLFNQLYPSKPIPKTIGFKEIRWYRSIGPDKFNQSLNWLGELRKPFGIIFLFRNLDNVMQSGWWVDLSPDRKLEERQKLEKFEELSVAYAERYNDSSLIISYEEFISDQAIAESICEFIGVKFSERIWRETLSQVLSHMKK